MTEEEGATDIGAVPNRADATPSAPQVLEYAGPTTRPPRFRLSDHPRVASSVFGTLAGGACLVLGRHNGSLLLAVPFGALVGFAVYFIYTATRRQWAGLLAGTQLVATLALGVVVVFHTFVRGAQAQGGPGGLRYWIVQPGYHLNPRWAMQDLWLAAVAAGWFLVVAAWLVGRNLRKTSACRYSSHAE
jgi:hypothetical protein